MLEQRFEFGLLRLATNISKTYYVLRIVLLLWGYGQKCNTDHAIEASAGFLMLHN